MQTRPGSTVPSMKYVLALVALFLVRITFTSGQQDSQFSGVSPFPAGNNTYTNGTLAPYFHNVTATYTWILPRGKYDIGAGSMMCECFDPAGTSCFYFRPNYSEARLTRDTRQMDVACQLLKALRLSVSLETQPAVETPTVSLVKPVVEVPVALA